MEGHKLKLSLGQGELIPLFKVTVKTTPFVEHFTRKGSCGCWAKLYPHLTRICRDRPVLSPLKSSSLCLPVPEQPRFLRILNFDKDSVTLSWGLPKKANGHITGYILQYQISMCLVCFEFRIEAGLVKESSQVWCTQRLPEGRLQFSIHFFPWKLPLLPFPVPHLWADSIISYW